MLPHGEADGDRRPEASRGPSRWEGCGPLTDVLGGDHFLPPEDHHCPVAKARTFQSFIFTRGPEARVPFWVSASFLTPASASASPPADKALPANPSLCLSTAHHPSLTETSRSPRGTTSGLRPLPHCLSATRGCLLLPKGARLARPQGLCMSGPCAWRMSPPGAAGSWMSLPGAGVPPWACIK